MARFVKIELGDNDEIVLDLDKIERIEKGRGLYYLYIGDGRTPISKGLYDHLKELLCPDYPHY